MTIQEMLSTEKLAILNKILPVVIRVHGSNHPELAKVGEIYANLANEEKAKDEMRALISEMNDAANDFVVPADACPTYAKTYALLSKLKDAILSL